jgi:beta-glucanase (GH16 family)
LNYFAGGKPRGAKTIALPFDASKAHHHYAFEWLPDSIKWYVDGELVHEVFAGNGKMPIPTASGRVMSNIWAAKSTTLDWTGPVLFDTVSAHYVCMSHVPMGKTGRQCGDIPLGDVGKQK